MCIKDITKLVGEFDVISFDIFDTLLLRPFVKPTDVWRDVEEREGARGFFDARQKADRETYRAATERGGEHTIDEAYKLMGDKWKGFKEKELECERRLLAGNPEMIEVWNRVGELGKKRIIISDMYVDEDWLKNTLRQNGIDGWDGFYLSSRIQKRKSTGELYKVMKRDFGEAKYLHIGDNEWSDVEKAEENGVVAIRCPKVIDCAYEEFPFLRKFLEGRQSLDRSRLVGTLAIGWNKYKYEHPDFTFWNKIGFMLGGVLGYSYVRWIITRCKALGINHLMFVGRDGYVWQKIAAVIAPEIKSDYFYAPRTISVRVMGISTINGHEYVARDRQRFARELNIANDTERARTVYSEYIAKFNIDSNHTALVDGMSSQFSAQRLVEEVVGSKLFTFYLVAYSYPITGEGYIQSDGGSVRWQRFSEYLFGSPEAPIVDMTSGGPVFKEAVDSFEKFRMSVCDEIASVAVDCARAICLSRVVLSQRDWEDYYDLYSATIGEADLSRFELARISLDVNHLECYRIFNMKPMGVVHWWTRGQRLRILGRPVFRVRGFIKEGVSHKSLWLFGILPIWRKVKRLYHYAEA